MQSLKWATSLDAKSIYFISNQMEGFAQINKWFEKTLYDYAIAFYKDNKAEIKKKQAWFLKDDLFNQTRYTFKTAYYTEIIKM